MKNLKEIKSGIIIGISFLTTVLLGGIIYAAVGSVWTNPDDILASSGAALKSDSWNKMLANMNSLSGSINNSNWTLDTSGNGVLFDLGCDYKFELFTKGTTTLLQIDTATALIISGNNLQFISPIGWFYIKNNEKNKLYQSGTSRVNDIGKIWKRCM
ncbi:MAG: hypothetical protein PHZ26_00125 [Candidatus Gracilibacteria bacterium]|nr:hypothetical protein [Candidatus Gracilibacteria bacterium]MDD2908143.1 hypothetical protein [Candidatus Gracilibacteria bacterium]